MVFQKQLIVSSTGRGFTNITELISTNVKNAKIEIGSCNVYVQHTSASLIISENADPDVLIDLESFMSKLIPDGSSWCKHTLEGPDDMPAHIRSVLTQTSLTIPIQCGQLALGQWQAIYLWEHRLESFSRKVLVTIQ